MSGRRFDEPETDAFTRPYWDAAAEGVLLLRRCAACGRTHHYPREFCPHCWSDDVTWERASGRATLYTWSVVHRNDLPPFGERTPYVAAVVDLAEGPRMMTEVVECAAAELRVGMELEAAFRTAGEVTVPVFRPRGPVRIPGAREHAFADGRTDDFKATAVP
ncbi:Zn-ribbon domain-containing OB-fold protein [Streptomyces avermitilis]|uniref:Zn-ribbon domain-containing OB-fold protein n=1 Tax=Streptomyces avermitilis TaxID=33903 RepID=UPI0033CC1199